jgi:predicted 3-demethylubiquinone-9 3-methyltransferase (glyoxalase superfamily)
MPTATRLTVTRTAQRKENSMQKIVTTLWFDGRVQEAVDFYMSIFDNSRIKAISRYGDAGPGPKREILTADFVLAGQEFTIINGGPGFPHSPAISLLIHCETQAEVDAFWEKLSEGGEKGQCGWLTDRYGVSRQVVHRAMDRMLQDADQAQAQRVMKALMAMTKIDITELEKAYNDG